MTVLGNDRTTWVLGICLGFVVLAVLTAQIWTPQVHITASTESARVGKPISEDLWRFEPRKAEKFSQTVARPLFHPDRTSLDQLLSDLTPEAAPTAEPQARATAAVSSLLLIGTIVAEGRESAIIKSRKGNEAEVFTIGDVIEGWEVLGITKDGVKLSNGRDQHKLIFPDAGL